MPIFQRLTTRYSRYMKKLLLYREPVLEIAWHETNSAGMGELGEA